MAGEKVSPLILVGSGLTLLLIVRVGQRADMKCQVHSLSWSFQVNILEIRDIEAIVNSSNDLKWISRAVPTILWYKIYDR